jgi:hypothetical protein
MVPTKAISTATPTKPASRPGVHQGRLVLRWQCGQLVNVA